MNPISLKFRMVITCDNAAFDIEEMLLRPEIGRILRDAADRLEMGFCDLPEPGAPYDALLLRDVNGNTVGKCSFIEEYDDGLAL